MSRIQKKRNNVTTTPLKCSRCPAKVVAHAGVRGKPHRKCPTRGERAAGKWALDDKKSSS